MLQKDTYVDDILVDKDKAETLNFLKRFSQYFLIPLTIHETICV